jgi:hypothetical protein
VDGTWPHRHSAPSSCCRVRNPDPRPLARPGWQALRRSERRRGACVSACPPPLGSVPCWRSGGRPCPPDD